jgi:hypothetical protein
VPLCENMGCVRHGCDRPEIPCRAHERAHAPAVGGGGGADPVAHALQRGNRARADEAGRDQRVGRGGRAAQGRRRCRARRERDHPRAGQVQDRQFARTVAVARHRHLAARGLAADQPRIRRAEDPLGPPAGRAAERRDAGPHRQGERAVAAEPAGRRGTPQSRRDGRGQRGSRRGGERTRRRRCARRRARGRGTAIGRAARPVLHRAGRPRQGRQDRSRSSAATARSARWWIS